MGEQAESTIDEGFEAVEAARDDLRTQVAELLKQVSQQSAGPELGRTVSPSINPIGEAGATLEFSAETDQILPAILAFRRACSGMVGKDGVNPFYGSTYSTLAAVKRAVDGPLNNADLLVIHGTRILGYHTIRQYDKERRQWIEGVCARMAVTTYLMHAPSGQYVRNSIVMDSRDTGPHAIGSVETYGRRYNTLALLDVAPEDDDGNAGQGGVVRGSAEPRRGAPQPATGRQSAGARAQHRARGKKGKRVLPTEVVQARKRLQEDLMSRVEGDQEAFDSLVREIGEGLDLETVEGVAKAFERAQEHSVFGDERLEAEAKQKE